MKCPIRVSWLHPRYFTCGSLSGPITSQPTTKVAVLSCPPSRQQQEFLPRTNCITYSTWHTRGRGRAYSQWWEFHQTNFVADKAAGLWGNKGKVGSKRITSECEPKSKLLDSAFGITSHRLPLMRCSMLRKNEVRAAWKWLAVKAMVFCTAKLWWHSQYTLVDW